MSIKAEGSQSPKIGGIMVLYKPDWAVTIKAIQSLISQVDKLVIVDNSPGEDNSRRLSEFMNIDYVPLGENRGIAAAQNVGIKVLIENGFDFIIFSDQDSIAENNIVNRLLKEFLEIKDSNSDIGLIGPMAVNRTTGEEYVNRKKIEEELTTSKGNFYICQSIISSFSIVPSILFEMNGFYEEKLFIDFVENEWCFRLRAKTGLKSVMSRQCKISHQLGTPGSFLGLSINISSPFRLYYQIRNFFLLSKRSYVPKRWKKQVGKKITLKLLYYSIVPKNRNKYFRSIVRGIRDGFCNKK